MKKKQQKQSEQENHNAKILLAKHTACCYYLVSCDEAVLCIFFFSCLIQLNRPSGINDFLFTHSRFSTSIQNFNGIFRQISSAHNGAYIACFSLFFFTTVDFAKVRGYLIRQHFQTFQLKTFVRVEEEKKYIQKFCTNFIIKFICTCSAVPLIGKARMSTIETGNIGNH